MKTIHNTKIMGIDHGYGNMKTANHCFKTGISAYDSEPLFTADMLVHGGRYYIIGEGHKEFAPDKIKDEDYYVLTLAAIAKELKAENLTEAHIVIAAGLPLTWTSGQKAEFKAYLSKNAEVEFVLRYNKQGLCAPKSESEAADFLAALLFEGLRPPIPRKGEMILWGKIYESPCVSQRKKKIKYNQKPESAG